MAVLTLCIIIFGIIFGFLGLDGLNRGPRGGVYHYSKNGKKVYHKRK